MFSLTVMMGWSSNNIKTHSTLWLTVFEFLQSQCIIRSSADWFSQAQIFISCKVLLTEEKFSDKFCLSDRINKQSRAITQEGISADFDSEVIFILISMLLWLKLLWYYEMKTVVSFGEFPDDNLQWVRGIKNPSPNDTFYILCCPNSYETRRNFV